jgi:tetratricopeptide (TPR) repeat protein
MRPDAAQRRHAEVAAAYRAQVDGFGPDAFYTVTRTVAERLDALDLEALLDFLRLSRYDARQVFRLAPRLIALAPDLSDPERDAVVEAIDRVWAGYFPIGEDDDLAAQTGRVLYAVDRFAPALTYFERSVALYGADSGMLFNMAACRFMLGQTEGCVALLERVIQIDPGNHEAALLLRECRIAP